LVNTTGLDNTAIGYDALFNNTTANNNTAIGSVALTSNTTGGGNTAVGRQALLLNTTGANNTANGFQALLNNTTGFGNTAYGVDALVSNTTGAGNVAVGLTAGAGITTANNVIAIGTPGDNVSNSCYIGQIFGSTSIGGSAVFVNEEGKLGTITSSRRFKDHIKPMDKASEVILALKPVSFRYKKEIDPAGRSQFGLVAEQVAEVNPDLVVCDKQGKPYTVRYDR
jgi:Chaperone of endosialidase